jgi:NADH dehydrogenase
VTTLFITGGSGYIGTRLLQKSTRLKYERIDCLQHGRAITSQDPRHCPPINVVPGDLLLPQTYTHMLTADTTVLHLAAQTGKAPPASYFAINTRGTELLVQHCRHAGVRRLVYVSSIAVSYTSAWPYYYAESKRLAEAAVRNSGLAYTIVRPTIVIGANAPVTRLLLALARLPVIAILGDGTTVVQPIDIEDLVDSLVDFLNRNEPGDNAYDLGGAQQLSIEALVRGFSHIVLGRKHPAVIRLPRLFIGLVALLERFCFGLLPVTAGQLSLFVESGSVRSGGADAKTSVPLQDVAGMLQRLAVEMRRTNV